MRRMEFQIEFSDLAKQELRELTKTSQAQLTRRLKHLAEVAGLRSHFTEDERHTEVVVNGAVASCAFDVAQRTLRVMTLRRVD